MGFLGKGGMMDRRKEQQNYQEDLTYGEVVPPDVDDSNEEFPEASNHSPLAEAPVDSPEHMDQLTDVDLPDPGPGELPDAGVEDGQFGSDSAAEDPGALDPGGLNPASDSPEIDVTAGPQSPESPAPAPGVEDGALHEARRKVGQIMSQHFFGGSV